MDNRFATLLHRQQELFWSDKTKTAAWRRLQLERMKRMLNDHRDAWCEAIHADYGKPRFEQAFEVMVPTGVIDNYLAHLDAYMAPEERELPQGLADMGYRGMIYREPFGPTLVIGPFNAPLLLVIDPAVAALAAGNPVVLKPSNSTPEVAALFEKLVPQYFEREAVTVVTGGHEEISELLKLPFDFIFFTGSSNVGKVVMRAAAEHLTPVILELGGQNPAIVDATADLDLAAERIAWGHIAMSGQWCIAPRYVCVERDVADEFIARLKLAIRRMYTGNPKESPDLARMISVEAAEKVADAIVEDKVVHGGSADPEERFIDPTVLYPADWSDPAMQEEVFGPVLSVLRYDDLEDVIASIVAKPKPLACYIFSEDSDVIDTIIHSVPFGGGCVNQTNLHCWVDNLPFGGVGNSGLGKYYGKDGFDALSNKKSMLIARGKQGPDVFPPYEGKDIEKVLSAFA